MKTELSAIIIVFLSSFLGAAGQYYFKKGADAIAKISLIKILFNKNIITAVILYLSGSVAYIIALPRGELSVLYPIVASNFIWVVLIAKIKLKERLNFGKVTGLVLIIAGIILIGFTA